jgi:hypothetical protein
MTFTLGDSMSVAEEPTRRVYKLEEMVALFLTATLLQNLAYPIGTAFRPALLNRNCGPGFRTFGRDLCDDGLAGKVSSVSVLV